MPERTLLVVSGTATGVGKTWAAAELLRALRAAGVPVAARKPVQSFTPGEGPTDAELLAAASGEDPHRVCLAHRWLPEGVGGPRSPLADDGDTVDLAAALDADAVLLVAEAGLGAINAVRLAAAAFARAAPVSVLLNRYHPAERLHPANLAWLRDRCGLDVLVEVAGLAARLARSHQLPLPMEAP